MEKSYSFASMVVSQSREHLRNRRYDRSMDAVRARLRVASVNANASRSSCQLAIFFSFSPSIYHFYHAEAVALADRKKYARTDDSCYDFFFFNPSPLVFSDPCSLWLSMSAFCCARTTVPPFPLQCGSFNLHGRLFAARSQRLFTDVLCSESEFFRCTVCSRTAENCSFLLSFFVSRLPFRRILWKYVRASNFENRFPP